ncbi:MAG: hypothetical protein IJM79_06530 [Erysipelotrichaceae bacterium]|nr:hypothetical protein [Erysipelotrichaceae bacterium]
MSKEMKMMVAVIVLTMVIQAGLIYLQRHLINKLTTALLKGDYDGFDRLIDKWYVMYVIAPFNVDYLKLNRYSLEGDREKITACYDGFNNKRLNYAQAKQVYLEAFDYFLGQKDRERCLFYREKINALSSKKEDLSSIKQLVNDSYDIYIDNKSDMLERLLEQNEKLPESHRGSNEALIARIYENKGSKKKAEEYRKLSEEHLKMLLRERKKKS